MAAVGYEYYSEVYGGGLSEAAFVDNVAMAESHVRWLCAVNGVDESSEPFMRAVCAATEAFAEFGCGTSNGFRIGDFEVRRYSGDDGASGEDMATRAAMRELAGTGMAFAGVR